MKDQVIVSTKIVWMIQKYTGIHYVHVYVMHYPVQSITKALLTAEHFLFCEEAEKC